MIDNHLPNEVTENRIAMTLQKLNILQRKSEDTFVNTYGRNLIEFCKNTQMAIMNGRIGKDREFGRFTFMGSTNDTQNKQRLSLVDYIIGSANMFHYVTNLEVLNKFPESDHIPIHFSLNVNYTENTNNSGDENTQWFSLPKYVWNTNTLENLNIT